MVSVLFRARVSSFLAGVAVAGSICMLQMRGDVIESYKVLRTQVRNQWADCPAFAGDFAGEHRTRQLGPQLLSGRCCVCSNVLEL